MRHWVVLVLFLFALGTLRVVACGEESCVEDEDCDDGNPCSRDYCYSYDPDAPLCETVHSYCSHSQADDGTSCGSGKVCVDGVCGENLCKDVVCDDEPCSTGNCDYVDGLCNYTPRLPNGTACVYDGMDGVCVNGVCGENLCEDVVCDDGGACTEDVCDFRTGTCEYPPVWDGTPCRGGQCMNGVCVILCEANVCECSEAGIRAAVEAGGNDPYTFDCDGPTTVVTEAEIEIDHDVILDGEGNLTVDGDEEHGVFSVPASDDHLPSVELRGLTVTGGKVVGAGGGITNQGHLVLSGSTVTGNAANEGGGIANFGAATLTLMSSTVSGNTADRGGGFLHSGAALVLTNSTVSANTASEGGGIYHDGSGPVTLTNSTVSGNSAVSGSAILVNPIGGLPIVTTTATLMDGACAQQGAATWTSNGYNVESPGNSCRFDQATDQFDVTAAELNLGPLQDYGGTTETHALGAGSVAIDHIPAVDCEVTEDQRGQSRPETGGTMCDVGAFEVQP